MCRQKSHRLGWDGWGEDFGRRRRANPGSPLPPEGFDLGLDMIESQCAATCDPGEATPSACTNADLMLSTCWEKLCHPHVRLELSQLALGSPGLPMLVIEELCLGRGKYSAEHQHHATSISPP